jgi:hypothetical protein
MTNISKATARVNSGDSFEAARAIIESAKPKAIYARFDKCAFITSKELSPQIESRLKKFGFTIHDRKRRGIFIGKKLDITAPSPKVLEYLASKPQITPYRIESALDFILHNEDEADSLTRALQHTVVQPWAGKNRHRITCGNTTYQGQRDKHKPHHHLVIYGDRPFKLGRGFNHEPHCCHLEWRHQGLELLKRIGISRTGDLLAFDLAQFWKQRLPRCFYSLDRERYGRTLHNRWTGQKRRTRPPNPNPASKLPPYNADRSRGNLNYHIDALGVDGNRSLQQFVKNTGRGPWLHKINTTHLTDAIKVIWPSPYYDS